MMSKAAKSLPNCRKITSRQSLSYGKPHITTNLLSETHKGIDSATYRTLSSINVKYRVKNRAMCMHPSYNASNPRISSVLSFPDVYFANNVELTHRFSTSTILEDGRRPGFFSNIVENLKSEYSKSKEMQDSLKKFR